MGRSGSGKTSMRSIIFANFIAPQTSALPATIDVDSSSMRLFGNLNLNLWDCGGQDTFVEGYFSKAEHIFSNVSVMIFVFDLYSSEERKELEYFGQAIKCLRQFSPDSKIFCLLHKIDRIEPSKAQMIIDRRKNAIIKIAEGYSVTCYGTSIWDESLYKAWSDIVYSMIPNIKLLERQVDRFCMVCEADEVILFERSTFLVITHAKGARRFHDPHRFEKISNIVKQFKLSCSKMSTGFSSMEVRNSRFTAYLDQLTNSTYVLVVMSDPSIQAEAIHINIQSAQRHFDKFFEKLS